MLICACFELICPFSQCFGFDHCKCFVIRQIFMNRFTKMNCHKKGTSDRRWRYEFSVYFTCFILRLHNETSNIHFFACDLFSMKRQKERSNVRGSDSKKLQAGNQTNNFNFSSSFQQQAGSS